MSNEQLIPKHGGYRSLKSFQIGQLIYDLTVRFCDKYIDKRSRTHDQMVQAARSGVQNIAEGSHASGTSKKTELKLTSVARASLEELRLDYEDYLRQRNLPEWPPDHPALRRFKALRCSSIIELRKWIAEEQKCHKEPQNSTESTLTVPVPVSPCPSFSTPVLVANAALSLINLCCYLLDRQIEALAKSFETEGGFTERLYRVRSAHRRK
ncbi:four helix bundle suffix domain-containing protein [Chlorobium ferrooxidans]|uniref:S23 ribosomal n=1 Tax=Chlorobium ferrooxidans DSM 13031 TaxID=377431 RepID=Q0YQL6_9CHLB|nr:four helix bundle suffix domain-containing protein [Chlorobium ferrooxidans]EAT58622.1 hypothetical protein CferDRAFT_0542 [Chlorobium ferrooxidans DSM 13031]